MFLLTSSGVWLIRKNTTSSASDSQSSTNQKKKHPPSQPPVKPNNDNPSSPPSDPNQPNPTPLPTPKPNNNLSKKTLANLIKSDLQEKIKNPNNLNLYSYHELAGGNVYTLSDNEEIKSKIKPLRNDEGREIAPHDLESEDWKEIIGLVRQLEKLKKDRYEQEEREKEDKLKNNPQLFYYYTSGSMERKGTTFYLKKFLGKRNGINFHLYISKNHPALTNIGSHLDKTESERFYLITG